MPIVPADLDAATAREAELIARVQAAGRTKILQEELVGQTARLETQLFEDPLTHVHNPSLARVAGGTCIALRARHRFARLLRRADNALYDAKTAGRNCVRGPATLPRRT